MKQLQILEWADIPQMEGYQACSDGRIRSVHRMVPWKFGYRSRKGKILKPYINNRGYLEVHLHLKEHKMLAQTVHKLVMRAFSQKPFENAQINHKNGIKIDNRLENLEWCTQSENQLHAWRIGLKKDLTGNNNPNSKLSFEDVLFIRENYDKRSLNQVKMAERFNVSQAQISAILKNKTWVSN